MIFDRACLDSGLLALLAAAAVSSGCASVPPAAGPVAFPGAPAPTASNSRSAGVGAGGPIVETVLAFVGTPYRLGGDSPTAGFDCSGLVRYTLAQHHVAMPRTVAEQFAVGRPVGADELRPGDLVFFSTDGPGATHVGIVLDAARDRTFVHAPSEGGAVRIEQYTAGYWWSRFVGGRRVF